MCLYKLTSPESCTKFFSFIGLQTLRKRRMIIYIVYLMRNQNRMTTLNKILRDYNSLGLPGCIGSVDCVHIGWMWCPSYQQNRLRFQGVSISCFWGGYWSQKEDFVHQLPSSRNKKGQTHVEFDAVISNLNDIYSFLGRQEWHALSDDSSIPCKGYYFICDRGYLWWPLLICLIKYGDEHWKERA